MNEKPTRPSRRLRSTLDRVLVHDIKNMGFRLQLLLSNLEENYGNPEFKRSVEELLRSTVDRIDGIVDRFSTGDEPVLIKVPLDLNEVVSEVAEGETRRGLSVPPAVPGTRTLSLALGAIPQIWGDPYYLTDAVKSLIENALEAVPPEGRVLVRTFRDEYDEASARHRRDHRQRFRHDARVRPGSVCSSLSRRPSPTASGSGWRPPARSSISTTESSPFSPAREAAPSFGSLSRQSPAGVLRPTYTDSRADAPRDEMTVSPGAPGTIVIVEDDPILLDQLTWALKGRFEVDERPGRRRGAATLRIGSRPLSLRSPAPAFRRDRGRPEPPHGGPAATIRTRP